MRLPGIVAGLAALCCAGAAAAHDARPLSVAIVEQTEGLYRAVVRAPPSVDGQNTPQIVWPDACMQLESAPLSYALGSTNLVSCTGGLQDRTIRVVYPLYNPSITTLFRLQTADGTPITAVMPPDRLEWKVPAKPKFLSVARDYLVLGFKHIWGGPDHLLFVAGLLLLARIPRRIIWAVTGFTAAHSITLSLAVLGFVRVPVQPVEAMIALSILFLAGEIARDDSTSFSSRFPVVLSFVFGLLHGFGFASALGEIGLPGGELAAGLAFFNLGVEAGQLAFILALASIMLGWRRLPVRLSSGGRLLEPGRAQLVGAYALGVPAAFWFIQRSVLALAS